MNHMNLYLIRHGQSTANFDGTHSGWSCVELTEKGRKQALAARKNVEHVKFDKLFVSDVLRTQQTADILFPSMERSFITVARELNNTAMKGKSPAQMTELYGEAYLKCREKFDYTDLHIDCESLQHLLTRAQDFLDMIADMKDAENVAVVSHAGFITSVFARVMGLDYYPRTVICNNLSVNVFEYKNGVWKLKLWNLAPEVEE